LGSNGRLDEAFLRAGNPSFSKFLTEYAPELLIRRFAALAGAPADEVRHGTTILAATFADGVITAADRQVTAGSMISSRYAEKIQPADAYCCIGTAGTAALGVEIARLYQVELEHYEKIEGVSLTFDGKANRLSKMIFENLEMAMRGLCVVPLLSGYDLDTGVGRIISYDPLGGRTEEHHFHAVGSGSVFAMGALKKMHSSDLAEVDAVTVCLQALYDASEEDVYTMGSDLTRDIFPVVYVTTADGNRRLGNDEVGALMRAVIEFRTHQPDGPRARATG
jgi:proteasome beta subunit